MLSKPLRCAAHKRNAAQGCSTHMDNGHSRRIPFSEHRKSQLMNAMQGIHRITSTRSHHPQKKSAGGGSTINNGHPCPAQRRGGRGRRGFIHSESSTKPSTSNTPPSALSYQSMEAYATLSKSYDSYQNCWLRSRLPWSSP